MRITVNRQNTEIMIKRSVSPNKWNQKKECATGTEPSVKEINTFIEVNRAKVFKIFRQLEMDGRDITSRNIMDILQGREDPARAKTLIELFTEHNKQARSLIGIDFAKVTVDKFDTFILRLKEYLFHKYKTKDFKFVDIDNDFIRNYDFFLKTERGCHHNSVLKHLKNLKKMSG